MDADNLDERVALTQKLIHELAGGGSAVIFQLAEPRTLTKRQIAKVAGVSHTTVNNHLTDYAGPWENHSRGVFLRDPREGRKNVVQN